MLKGRCGHVEATEFSGGFLVPLKLLRSTWGRDPLRRTLTRNYRIVALP